jgi:hypothetical protein
MPLAAPLYASLRNAPPKRADSLLEAELFGRRSRQTNCGWLAFPAVPPSTSAGRITGLLASVDAAIRLFGWVCLD